MSAVWWTELRGLVAVALVAGGIAFAWTRIESRPIDDVETTSTSTTTTTTTIVATSTTPSREDVNLLICGGARDLISDVALLDPAAGPGPVARLALEFWQHVESLSDRQVRAEVTAVVNYYEDYLETAQPFDFDTARIIVEGDKEKLQQLITRPAPGLEGSRALIGFACGVEVPDQPSMGSKAFEDLEDRVLDDDN
jgi:hypothetical protein